MAFDFRRINESVADVFLPLDASRNVRTVFVSDIFPRFMSPPGFISYGKYVNRREDFDELAEGQAGNYYVHSRVSKMGDGSIANALSISVPKQRSFYLDSVQAYLAEQPRCAEASLNSHIALEKELLDFLFKELEHSDRNTIYRGKSGKSYRDAFGSSLVDNRLFSGYFTSVKSQNVRANQIDKMNLGSLPLSMFGRDLDFLRVQTILDFLTTIDDSIKGGDLSIQEIVQGVKERYAR